MFILYSFEQVFNKNVGLGVETNDVTNQTIKNAKPQIIQKKKFDSIT